MDKTRTFNLSERAFSRAINLRIAIACILALVLFNTFFLFAWVPSGSMLPTLSLGEIIIATRTNENSKIERGDILTFHPPGANDDTVYVKRVIGLPGDTVAVKDGKLFLNGEEQTEEYLNETSILGSFEETVPEGHYFMMGDNRNFSSDSRVFGSVPADRIQAKSIIHFPSLVSVLL